MEPILKFDHGVDFIAVATIAPDYYGGGFPPLHAHRLVSAAWCRLKPASGTSKQDAVACQLTVDSTAVHDLDGEVQVLRWCQDHIHDEKLRILGTFYGDRFALPLLYWRSCRYGTALLLPSNAHRFDLADWTTFGFQEQKKLSISDCAESMGMPKRFGTDIQNRFFDQDFESIQGFVETDLLIYSLVWLRFMLVLGEISKEQFAASGHTVMTTFHARTQMAKEYIKQFDYRNFFMLPPKKEPTVP